MFGLSWGQVAVIVLVGVFLLGPERIPTAVQWVVKTLKKARTMAAGAQEQLRGEIGPELEELRRQVADLQSLKELQELKELRNLHPRKLIGQTLLGGEDLSIKGLLGVDAKAPLGSGVKPTAPASPSVPAAPAPQVAPVAAAPAVPAPSATAATTTGNTVPTMTGNPEAAPAPSLAKSETPAARPVFDTDAT